MKRRGPLKWQANCPFCVGKNNRPDSNGHMTLYLESDSFKCHRCGEHGGKLALYAKTHACDNSQAYREIIEIREGRKETSPFRVSQKAIEPIESNLRASIEECHNTYRSMMNLLTLTSTHRENLHRRGLSDTEIDRLGYKSVPQVGHCRIASDLLAQGCVLEGVSGFYIDNGEKWRMNAYHSGIMMPSRDANGRIQGIQVRKDNVNTNKCYWLTGSEKKAGTPLQTRVHFTKNPKGSETALLTEGTMKADIAAYLSGEFFVSIPGTSHFPAIREAMPVLRRIGIHNILLCFDMDLYINPCVMQNLETVARMFLDAGFHVAMREWDRTQKGIDDYLWFCKQHNSRPKFEEIPCERLLAMFDNAAKTRIYPNKLCATI